MAVAKTLRGRTGSLRACAGAVVTPSGRGFLSERPPCLFRPTVCRLPSDMAVGALGAQHQSCLPLLSSHVVRASGAFPTRS